MLSFATESSYPRAYTNSVLLHMAHNKFYLWTYL